MSICLLAGCAVGPVAPVALPPSLWKDSAFAAPAQPVPAAADTLFAMSPQMLEYAQRTLPTLTHFKDPRRALLHALYQRDALRLTYDDSRTRTAAEAFADRSGNCLSLVAMTAAFAKHLGLPVTFQEIVVPETFSRRGGLYLSSGHVNLVLARPRVTLARERIEDADLTVDFLPGVGSGARARAVTESTLVAMYLNNRAAELLTDGLHEQGYWWVRAAIAHQPSFLPALNTLAVVYLRAQLPDQAEIALRHLLVQDAQHTAALSNLVRTLTLLGRDAEAKVAAEQLAKLQPRAPFADFELGRQAMAAGQYNLAREHFDKELRQQPDQHEVLFWAAQAAWHLGDSRAVLRHLQRARENSPSREAELRYVAKLNSLRAARLE